MSPCIDEEREYRSQTLGKEPETLYSSVQRPVLAALGLVDYPITELTLRMNDTKVDLEMKATLTFSAYPVVRVINPLSKQTKP